MTNELVQSTNIVSGQTKLNYLWLNGERVLGIEGLQLFEDCRLLHQVPVIREEQRSALNNIINATLEKNCEEGLCNYWPSLVEAARNYFSGQGYYVAGNKISLDLREKVELILEQPVEDLAPVTGKVLTVADLWHIQRLRRERNLRRYIW